MAAVRAAADEVGCTVEQANALPIAVAERLKAEGLVITRQVSQ